jgi:hypothetical protein
MSNAEHVQGNLVSVRSRMPTLPLELWIEIASHLPYGSFQSFASTSASLYSASLEGTPIRNALVQKHGESMALWEGLKGCGVFNERVARSFCKNPNLVARYLVQMLLNNQSNRWWCTHLNAERAFEVLTIFKKFAKTHWPQVLSCPGNNDITLMTRLAGLCSVDELWEDRALSKALEIMLHRHRFPISILPASQQRWILLRTVKTVGHLVPSLLRGLDLTKLDQEALIAPDTLASWTGFLNGNNRQVIVLSELTQGLAHVLDHDHSLSWPATPPSASLLDTLLQHLVKVPTWHQVEIVALPFLTILHTHGINVSHPALVRVLVGIAVRSEGNLENVRVLVQSLGKMVNLDKKQTRYAFKHILLDVKTAQWDSRMAQALAISWRDGGLIDAMQASKVAKTLVWKMLLIGDLDFVPFVTRIVSLLDEQFRINLPTLTCA